jgi:hypothetical protein
MKLGMSQVWDGFTPHGKGLYSYDGDGIAVTSEVEKVLT